VYSPLPKSTFAFCLCLLCSLATEPQVRAVPARPTMPGAVAAAVDSQQVAKRSPTAAMVRSLLVPGWGQWYNGKKWKAALVFGAELGLAANAALQNQYLQRTRDPLAREYYLSNRNTSNWILALVVVLSMLDAYVDAHFADFDESPDLAAGKDCRSPLLAREGVGGFRLSVSVRF